MRRDVLQVWLLAVAAVLVTATMASAQSFKLQCPTTTPFHPVAITNPSLSTSNPTILTEAAEPAYTGPTPLQEVIGGVPLTYINNGGVIKCQQISGGDGYMTEADGNQTFMFAFGPLSGLGLIQNGQPGSLFAADFNHAYTAGPNYLSGQPNPYYDGTTVPGSLTPGANGAIGYNPASTNPDGSPGNADIAGIMNTGVMNGNIPAPLIAMDEDDEFFLTLSNVGMIMRPDLFEQHTVHFHGYPNASSFYDGVPDATLAINIGGSFTYYYLAPDAGTYFWHCHITPPEHLQMGMVGQLFVRPRQDRVTPGMDLYQADLLQQKDLRTACQGTGTNPAAGYSYASGAGNIDILCSAPLPIGDNGFKQGTNSAGNKYIYNDGDGSTRYDVDVPIQIHGFDPNFHFVGMTFNPEGFADMKDKYFLLNGRSYPDTIGVPGYAGLPGAVSNPDPVTNAISTQDSDGQSRPSQPLPTLITLSASGAPAGTCGQQVCGQRAALRISDLDVTEYQTLASLGIPMHVVGFNAKLLRDQAGNNLPIVTNSITLGGGESLDVIIDSTGVSPGTYFLYTTNLDHLSNDAENFGGLMTEVVVTP